MNDQPIEVVQVKVHKWLGQKPRTIVFERSENVVNLPRITEIMANETENWPQLNFVPSNRLSAVHYKGVWRRGIFKFYCDKKQQPVIQLVDISQTVNKTRYTQIRSIENESITSLPWGFSKAYLFGVNIDDEIVLNQDVVQAYEDFFANQEITMIAVPLAQKRFGQRRVYLCDFMKQTRDGFISFRNFLIKNCFIEIAYPKDPVNKRMTDFVANMLNNRNAARVLYTLERTLQPMLEPTLQPIKLESTAAHSPIENTEFNTNRAVLISNVPNLSIGVSHLTIVSRVHMEEIITINDVLRAQFVSEDINFIREIAYGSVGFSFIIDF